MSQWTVFCCQHSCEIESSILLLCFLNTASWSLYQFKCTNVESVLNNYQCNLLNDCGDDSDDIRGGERRWFMLI